MDEKQTDREMGDKQKDGETTRQTHIMADRKKNMGIEGKPKRQLDIQKDKQTGRQAGRQRDRQTWRKTDRQKGR